MTLHTKIQEREALFVEEIGEMYTQEWGEVGDYKTREIHVFNRTSSIELLLEVVKEIEGMKQDPEYAASSRGGLECNERNYGYNAALTDIQNLITSQIKLIEG